MIQNAMVFLTIKEVAGKLGICSATVRKLIHAGSLRAVAFGTGSKKAFKRIAAGDLEAFIRDRTRAGR